MQWKRRPLRTLNWIVVMVNVMHLFPHWHHFCLILHPHNPVIHFDSSPSLNLRRSLDELETVTLRPVAVSDETLKLQR
jgi:hypothetical protein